MEDVFYLCPQKITVAHIKQVFQNISSDNIISDDERLQIIWKESEKLQFIEFYLFPDYMYSVDEEETELMLDTIRKYHVSTVVGILHHTRHIPIVLKYTALLMQKFGGVLGTDTPGFFPCFSLAELQKFQHQD
ncbi:MAG: hypothetical protein E7496_00395 [Ruminococcus sp.]|nr:hypothetical protein [Ruminococcus sp.]